ncbi:7434_t:CDS:2 [Cetraspora pellucida]|uniref:7434_t:CDS:1 n=1 Tax=Cetraspora pellucida TaxID=1433469 RepID=A0A9N9ETD0_9GLOM|nr:7434_t:CDS:2 [Cetraspora pellucida]
MSGLTIPTIIDKKAKSQKLINNRPGYDMKKYDTLSVIRPNETPQQWAIRVRVPLQELVSEKKWSVYHVCCLYASFGKGKLVDYDYYRPKIHKTRMAICLNCWQLIQVNDVKPKKIYAFAIYRYIETVEPADLMKQHWDYSYGSARIIQNAWRRFKERDPSNAWLAWLSLPNDNIPEDKKFLGLMSHEVKNPQTREQFNQWHTKWIEFYKNNPMMRSSIINRQYKEYYIPDNWIDFKKSQLRNRFQKRLLEIEA